MCTPNTYLPTPSSNLLSGVIKGVGALTTTAKTLSDFQTNKANNAYRTQIALNNAMMAQKEANHQKQLGIEKARAEMISGLQETNKLKAKNSASGFDIMSDTNKQSYQDTMKMAKINAQNVLSEYANNSHDYINQANSYLNQAKTYKKEYGKSFFGYSLNALGQFQQVAQDWYNNREEN